MDLDGQGPYPLIVLFTVLPFPSFPYKKKVFLDDMYQLPSFLQERRSKCFPKPYPSPSTGCWLHISEYNALLTSCPLHLALPHHHPQRFIKGREADEWNCLEPIQRIIEKCAAQTMERGKWEQRDIGCVEWQQNDTIQSGYRFCKIDGEKIASFLLEMKTHHWNHWGK